VEFSHLRVIILRLQYEESLAIWPSSTIGVFPNTRSNAYQSKPNSPNLLRMAVMFKIRARPLPSTMPSRVAS
jgi:hypothetical protein